MNNKKYITQMVNNAKDFAVELHRGHRCIITGLEKWYHLESVVTKIKDLNLNNNLLLILAYLHDTLDYVDAHRRTEIIEEIKAKFDDHVAQLVLETTDNFKIEEISTPEGKSAFEARRLQIKSPNGISDDAAIVILAEKVCNLNAMYDACKKGPEDYWERLKSTHNLNKDDVKNYYDEVYDTLSIRCADNKRLRRLINDYDDLIYRIFS